MTRSSSESVDAEILANWAAESVRTVNHLTIAHDSLPEPAHVYRIIGHLYTLTQRLPQALLQLANNLERQQLSGALYLDELGGDHPDATAAVFSAVTELQRAGDSIGEATRALIRAQNDISGVAMRYETTGPG